MTSIEVLLTGTSIAPCLRKYRRPDQTPQTCWQCPDRAIAAAELYHLPPPTQPIQLGQICFDNNLSQGDLLRKLAPRSLGRCSRQQSRQRQSADAPVQEQTARTKIAKLIIVHTPPLHIPRIHPALAAYIPSLSLLKTQRCDARRRACLKPKRSRKTSSMELYIIRCGLVGARVACRRV